MGNRTTVTIGPDAVEQRGAILAGLVEFNASRAAPANASAVCVAIRNDEAAVVGGLFGTMAYDWLAIELLFVPEELRGAGLGASVIAQAERQAQDRGCIGAWLDTFSFQARGFYEKLGYSLAGTIADHPLGGARYFLMKRWD